MVKKPNFFIVGAAKSGTTSMHYYLKQHPEIFMTEQKETNYFVFKGQRVEFKGPGDDEYINKFSITDEKEYFNLFKSVKNEKIIGESSPAYLYYHKTAALNIKHFNPNSKIMIILRNPIERAYSQYSYFKKLGREKKQFKEAIFDEENRIKNGWEWAWFYLKTGLYYEQVRTFLEIFNDNVLILILKEFQKKPLKHFKKIFDFLEVDNKFIPFFSRLQNVSSERENFINGVIDSGNDSILKKFGRALFPRKYRLLIKYKINLKNKSKLKMDKEMKEYLKDYYKKDIEQLSHLLNKDLRFWLKI